ncbi:ATP-dependent RNA helicase DHX30 [Bicyclus anynana]|uniref:ATP-dependent RNA helicase DHX30 n=1 Tax=Bicyclus anynana TaxID=110368 RepID=A0ABM3LTN8_BICAN|nr:ATP-dependent RNA helicase DHX30 [Bicyclus anynana]
MFAKYLLGRINLRKRCLLIKESSFIRKSNTKNCSGISYIVHIESFSRLKKYRVEPGTNLLQTSTYSVLLQHRKWISKGLIDDVFKDEKDPNKKDLEKTNDIFAQPRVTLNEFAAKTGQKVFDIHYKQNVVAPKGGKKKPVQNDWTCTYTFVWPEKAKFESTAVSKRQAAEKAATQALLWLYKKDRIDYNGAPVHDKNAIQELYSTLNKPVHISLSENSVERIKNIWNDYETDIKTLYEATFKEANLKLLNMKSVSVLKDSTIDDQDFTDEAVENGSNKDDDDSDGKSQIHPVFGKHITQVSPSALMRRERMLRNTFAQYDENLTPLPIDQYAEQIISTLEKSRVAVIVGAAGCGKSTRVPAAILRHYGVSTAAIVSEPRRVAAIGLAQRVADELGEHVGESVGYQVRLHAKPPRPPAGAILYCTSGVLLRRLQLNPGLDGCTHVFIDEAHERDVNTDVTLLLLKRALDINPNLKIVVMSATLDTAVFTRYFDQCPVVEVPGRTFPVDITHVEDIQKKLNVRLPSTLENSAKEDGRPQIHCQEVVEVIKAVDKNQPEGAILVFLPGWAEIKQTKLLLDECYRNSALHLVLPVHSRLSTTDQTKMFSKPSPGVRKIVLSTNIAETSITIPDVVYVIDSGAHKENRIREGTGTASLETVWVSQAGAKQRAGRAGRVQPGICYKMYTKDKENEFAPHTTPEILRIPLEQTVLDCKMYAPEDKVENFLSELPEPPSKQAIRFAVNDLIDLGALTSSERLTRLGVLLSSMTLHPRLGRCVLNAAVVGDVIAVGNVATHCSDNVELFRNAADRRDEIREIKRKFSATSDHAALHWLQDEFEQRAGERGGEAERWCEQHGLRRDRLSYVKAISNLHLEHLLKTGVIEQSTEAEELNRFSEIDELTAAVLLSGSNSLLITKKYVKTKGKLMTVHGLFTSKGDRAHIGSESVNYGITKRCQSTQLLAYFGGYHSTERRALVVHKTTLIPAHTALLFSMGQITNEVVVCTFEPMNKIFIHKLRYKEASQSTQQLAYFGGYHSTERARRPQDDADTSAHCFAVLYGTDY